GLIRIYAHVHQSSLQHFPLELRTLNATTDKDECDPLSDIVRRRSERNFLHQGDRLDDRIDVMGTSEIPRITNHDPAIEHPLFAKLICWCSDWRDGSSARPVGDDPDLFVSDAFSP